MRRRCRTLPGLTATVTAWPAITGSARPAASFASSATPVATATSAPTTSSSSVCISAATSTCSTSTATAASAPATSFSSASGSAGRYEEARQAIAVLDLLQRQGDRWGMRSPLGKGTSCLGAQLFPGAHLLEYRGGNVELVELDGAVA